MNKEVPVFKTVMDGRTFAYFKDGYISAYNTFDAIDEHSLIVTYKTDCKTQKDFEIEICYLNEDLKAALEEANVDIE